MIESASTGQLSRLSQQIFFLLTAILPAILPFVRRAAPVILVLAAVLVVVHVIRHKVWRQAASAMPMPAIVLGASFLLWAAITCLWAPVPARSWQSVASGLLIFASGLSLLILPLKHENHANVFLALALSFAALTIMIDLKTGGVLLHLIHSRPDPYRYNMVLVSLVVLSLALFKDGVSRATPVRYVAVILLFAAVFSSESETAKLSILVGYLILVASMFVPRLLSLACFIIGVSAAWVIFIFSPDVFGNFAQLWPALAEHGHASERIQIWSAYAKFAVAGLPWGWGVESVAFVPMTSYYTAVPDVMKPWLEWLHPHNNVVQLVAEMGWPGIVLGMVSCFALVIWGHADERLRPARAGLVSAVVIVCLVSHGFWQMWWWSVVVIAISRLRRPLDKFIVGSGNE